jgi:hypothetical protein
LRLGATDYALLKSQKVRTFAWPITTARCARFLDAYLPPRDGEIVLQDGTVVGQHDGIEHFTIGQRKGLGIAWSEPLHVGETRCRHESGGGRHEGRRLVALAARLAR